MLLEKLESVLNAHKSLQTLQASLNELFTEQKAKDLLKDSFAKLEVELKNLLSKEQLTSQKALQDTLKQEQDTKLKELFKSNMHQIIEGLQINLPLEEISHNVATKFLEQNREVHNKIIHKAINSQEGILKEEVRKLASEITREKEKLINAVKDSFREDFTNNLQKQIKEHLVTNNTKLITQKQVKDHLNANIKLLEESINENVTKEVKQAFAKTNLDLQIQSHLTNLAKQTFKDTLAYKELVEERFTASLHLQAVSLQSELHLLTKQLGILAELKAKKEALKRENTFIKQTQRIFKVM